MIDTDKYEGHTKGKWNLTLEGHIVADNMTVVCNKYTKRIVETNHKDIQLIADAPLILQALIDERAEVKRLRERLMLAESALGEVRACHEDGQGNLGEILEHYRDKEGVEMPNAFDEVIE